VLTNCHTNAGKIDAFALLLLVFVLTFFSIQE